MRCLVLISALALTAAPQAPDVSAAASCCKFKVPPCQAYWESSAVFIGKVRQIEDTPDAQRVSFDVEQTERGASWSTITIEQSRPSLCGFPFQTGQRYVVYAYGDEQSLRVGACGRTAPVADAADDLAYFRELKGAGSGGHVFGSVRQEEPTFVAFDSRDIGPVAGQPIRLKGNGIDRSSTTAADGTYDFGGLLPGSYTLTLDAPKDMRIHPELSGVYNHVAPNSFAVELRRPRGCFPITFKLREPGGTVRGVLVDDKGAAVEAELVHIVAAANAERSDGVPMSRTWTGQDGQFEFTDLPRGQYVIGLNLSAPVDPAQFDRRAYFPGVRLPREATVVTVEGAGVVHVGKFRLRADPVERTITGVVLWDDDMPAADARVVVRGAIEQSVPVDAEGRFRVTLPYGAHFAMHASGRREVSGRMRASSTVATEIARNDRDREVKLVLPLPR